MNEAAAREVVLVQAFETAQPAAPTWGDDDRAWATRLALADAPGTRSGAESFIARRAHHAMQRLGPREPLAAGWMLQRAHRWRWVAGAAVAGLVVGVLADSIGSSQRINLLAPPLWAVLAWNLVVYVLLLGNGLAHAFMRPVQAGPLVQLTQRLLRLGGRRPGGGSSAAALRAFAVEWLRVSGPLSMLRAATLLHAAAAALALGLIAGLYLRGLVLDYRAVWESTFLSAGNARELLGWALAPAVALSGIGLPDAAAFEAMREVHGAAQIGAPAAPWIHLLALTLLLFVVLPRAVLTLLGAARARWRAGRIALPLEQPYFQRLARAARGDVARVLVAPYAATPGASAVSTLQTVFAHALGDTTQIEQAPTVAFGAEDAAGSPVQVPAGTTLAAALFDLSATPELENQGRFARRLALHATTLLLIDETAFAQRFKADPARLTQRRDAWRALASTLGTAPVFFDSGTVDEGVVRGVALAMRQPVEVKASEGTS
ncbi:MAG: DUF2868 domain-containing protein [Burkholderiales bacterium]